MEVHLLLVTGCALVLAIGCYKFSIATSKSIRANLLKIHGMAGHKKERKCLMGSLCELLEFHSRVKQLSREKKKLLDHSSINATTNSLTFHLYCQIGPLVFGHLPAYDYGAICLESVQYMRFIVNDSSSIGNAILIY